MVSWGFIANNSLNEKFSALDGLKNVLSSSHGNAGSLVLDEGLPHNAALDNKSVTLGTVVAEQTAGVKVLTDGLGKGTGVVGEEVTLGALSPPSFSFQALTVNWSFDGDNVDVVDALGLELVGVLDVAGDLRRAGAVDETE